MKRINMSTKDNFTMVRMLKDTREKLKVRAFEDRITMAELVDMLIDEHNKNEEAKGTSDASK